VAGGAAPLDGRLLCIAYLFSVFQDPLSNWFSPWITYNSYLVNIGSWTAEVPGWMSGGHPGAQAPEPLLWPLLYISSWCLFTAVGCAAMRGAKRRWPRVGVYRLLLAAFVAIAVADFVFEALIAMPLGFWTYAGGQLPIVFPDTYHAFPLFEMIFIGLMGTGFTALRYFKDDRGYTFVERGVEKISGPRRQGLYRLLALIGATQLIFLLGFTVPVSEIGAHARAWPAAVQERSYLNDHLCGAGTTRACPGPAVPLPYGNGSARLAPTGTLYVRPGTEIPPLVPLKK
jgi:Spirocyclase AveC-like